MPHRPFILSLALLAPLLLLLALGAATSAAQPDAPPSTAPANTLTRQRDVVDGDNAITAADVTLVAQTWGWQR